MIDYLIANKEWVFSGIGVLILGSLIGMVWRLFARRPPTRYGEVAVVRNVDSGDDHQTQAASGQRLSPITRIAPIAIEDIYAAVNAVPLLQRSSIAKRYEGISVEWETRLFSATEEDDGKVRLALDFTEGTPIVVCHVRLEEYRILGILTKGAPITVIGRIASVDATVQVVRLDEVQLLFHEAAP